MEQVVESGLEQREGGPVQRIADLRATVQLWRRTSWFERRKESRRLPPSMTITGTITLQRTSTKRPGMTRSNNPTAKQTE